MPSPKNGKPGSPVSPADPTKALAADVADPGLVEKIKAEQRQTQTGKYGSVKAEPYKPADSKPSDSDGTQGNEGTQGVDDRKTWIEIELVDKAGRPVAGEAYQITLPDGKIDKGTLNEKGFVRLDPVEPGTCRISFPNLEKQAWKLK